MEIPHILLEMNFLSKELGKNTQVNIILPHQMDEGKKCKTLWLLHGLKGDHTSWLRNTAIERYASKHDLCVIMPNVDRSWYTNTKYGLNYLNYITKELPEVCRRNFSVMSDLPEDNIIAGLSMGGYGAFKAALTCPDQYGYCISLSGAVDVTRKGRPCNLPEWQSIFGFDIKDPLELEGSEHDLNFLARRNKQEGLSFPKIYMWCGVDDALLRANNELDATLTELGVEHTYETSEGNHRWEWWDMHILPALDNVLAN